MMILCRPSLQDGAFLFDVRSEVLLHGHQPKHPQKFGNAEAQEKLVSDAQTIAAGMQEMSERFREQGGHLYQ